jgi:hypothetical protein
MPTFGFSAYLKLISLSPKRQRSEIKSRLSPSAGGYDFHRSLRLLAHQYMVDGTPLEEVLKSAEGINRAPERKSAKEGLSKLGKWRGDYEGEITTYLPALYESPTGIFKVSFTPNFGVQNKKGWAAIHVWNTASPELSPRIIYAALSNFTDPYSVHKNTPDDIGLLSLRNSEIYYLSEAADHSELVLNINLHLEEVFRDIKEELGAPKEGSGKGHPLPPPA